MTDQMGRDAGARLKFTGLPTTGTRRNEHARAFSTIALHTTRSQVLQFIPEAKLVWQHMVDDQAGTVLASYSAIDAPELVSHEHFHPNAL